MMVVIDTTNCFGWRRRLTCQSLFVAWRAIASDLALSKELLAEMRDAADNHACGAFFLR